MSEVGSLTLKFISDLTQVRSELKAIEDKPLSLRFVTNGLPNGGGANTTVSGGATLGSPPGAGGNGVGYWQNVMPSSGASSGPRLSTSTTVPFGDPPLSQVQYAEDLMRRRGEAAAAGNTDEADRLLRTLMTPGQIGKEYRQYSSNYRRQQMSDQISAAREERGQFSLKYNSTVSPFERAQMLSDRIDSLPPGSPERYSLQSRLGSTLGRIEKKAAKDEEPEEPKGLFGSGINIRFMAAAYLAFRGVKGINDWAVQEAKTNYVGRTSGPEAEVEARRQQVISRMGGLGSQARAFTAFEMGPVNGLLSVLPKRWTGGYEFSSDDDQLRALDEAHAGANAGKMIESSRDFVRSNNLQIPLQSLRGSAHISGDFDFRGQQIDFEAAQKSRDYITDQGRFGGDAGPGLAQLEQERVSRQAMNESQKSRAFTDYAIQGVMTGYQFSGNQAAISGNDLGAKLESLKASHGVFHDANSGNVFYGGVGPTDKNYKVNKQAYESAVELTKLQHVIEGVGIAARTGGMRLAFRGDSIGTGRANVDAQFGLNFRNGTRFYGNMGPTDQNYSAKDEQYHLAGQISDANVTRQQTLYGNETDYIGNRASGMTDFAARRKKLEADFDAETANMQAGPDYALRAGRYDADSASIDRDQKFAESRMDVGLATSLNALGARLNRNETGAQAIDIYGQTYNHMSELAQAGYGGEARLAGQAGIGEEQLLKQKYMDAFHGQSVDLRMMDVTNPRDQTDPGKVLADIQAQIDAIINAIKGLTAN